MTKEYNQFNIDDSLEVLNAKLKKRPELTTINQVMQSYLAETGNPEFPFILDLVNNNNNINITFQPK